MHLAFFVLYLILQISTNVASGQQCKPPEVSVFGKSLKGHTFKKVVVTQSFECQRLCENERKCLSLNFFISEKICELNNMTKEERPVDYVADQTRFYMGMWRIKGKISPLSEHPLAQNKQKLKSKHHYYERCLSPWFEMIAEFNRLSHD